VIKGSRQNRSVTLGKGLAQKGRSLGGERWRLMSECFGVKSGTVACWFVKFQF
jgi:hypothetical protein